MSQFNNRADVAGLYDEITVTDFSELSVELTALDIEKTANKEIWVKDELVITLTVTNLDDDLPVDNVVVTDQIDTDIAVLDELSPTLTINGVPQPSGFFTYVGGLFTANVGTIPAGGVAVITFQLTLAP